MRVYTVQAQHALKDTEKAKIRLNTFPSSNDMFNAAVESTKTRRLAHLLSANENSLGMTATSEGRLVWELKATKGYTTL